MSLLTELQAAVAVEHQVVYGYGVVGAHEVGAAREDAGSCLLRHQVLRDDLSRLVASRGGVSPPAEPAYALPFAIGRTAAAALAAHLEDAAAGAAWDVLAATNQGDVHERHVGIRSMISAAEWSSRWRDRAGGASLPPLPGQPD